MGATAINLSIRANKQPDGKYYLEAVEGRGSPVRHEVYNFGEIKIAATTRKLTGGDGFDRWTAMTSAAATSRAAFEAEAAWWATVGPAKQTGFYDYAHDAGVGGWTP